MNRQNLSKTIPLCFGVFIMSFLVGYLVLAWTEPTAAPPGGNVYAPINVGADPQYKIGELIINTGGGDPALIVVGEKTNPVAGACPTGYNWYDYDGDGVIDNGECQRTLYYGKNSGNVGIGTTEPKTALDINGALSIRGIAAPAVSPAGQGRIYFDSAANKFKVSENGGNYEDLVKAGAANAFVQNGNSFGEDATLGTNDAYSLNFKTVNTTRLTIDTSGRIGIGVSPTSTKKLYVSDTGTGLSMNGVYSYVSGYATATGIYGYTSQTSAGYRGYGVYGKAEGVANTINYGLYGSASGGSTNWGLYINAGDAYFNGNVGIGTSPGTKLDVSGGNIRTDKQLVSTVATGTAPLSVSSTTLVSNLNADLLDGQHGSYYTTTLKKDTDGSTLITSITECRQSYCDTNGVYSGPSGGSCTRPTSIEQYSTCPSGWYAISGGGGCGAGISLQYNAPTGFWYGWFARCDSGYPVVWTICCH